MHRVVAARTAGVPIDGSSRAERTGTELRVLRRSPRRAGGERTTPAEPPASRQPDRRDRRRQSRREGADAGLASPCCVPTSPGTARIGGPSPGLPLPIPVTVLSVRPVAGRRDRARTSSRKGSPCHGAPPAPTGPAPGGERPPVAESFPRPSRRPGEPPDEEPVPPNRAMTGTSADDHRSDRGCPTGARSEHGPAPLARRIRRDRNGERSPPHVDRVVPRDSRTGPSGASRNTPLAMRGDRQPFNTTFLPRRRALTCETIVALLHRAGRPCRDSAHSSPLFREVSTTTFTVTTRGSTVLGGHERRSGR